MKVIVNGYIIASQEAWMEEPEFQFREYDSSAYAGSGEVRAMVRPHTIEFEVPDDFDMRPGILANLEAEKKKITAAFQARITELDAQIQSLLAIEA